MIASYGCYVVAQLFFAGSEGSRPLSRENRRVDLVVIALALNLYYVAGSAKLSTVLSQLGGWRAGQSMIRAGILGFVLVVGYAAPGGVALSLGRAGNGAMGKLAVSSLTILTNLALHPGAHWV